MLHYPRAASWRQSSCKQVQERHAWTTLLLNLRRTALHGGGSIVQSSLQSRSVWMRTAECMDAKEQCSSPRTCRVHAPPRSETKPVPSALFLSYLPLFLRISQQRFLADNVRSANCQPPFGQQASCVVARAQECLRSEARSIRGTPYTRRSDRIFGLAGGAGLSFYKARLAGQSA